MAILITGGAGYIGSHAAVALQEAGHEVVILDNLVNAKRTVMDRIAQITGKQPTFILGDVTDRARVDQVFRDHPIDAVMHFAGLKAVGESVAQPLRYYHNNVTGSLVLLEAMAAAHCRTLIFSSTATVYGEPETSPVTEAFPLAPTQPYAMSKRMVERLCEDLVVAEDGWRIALLRYFNPIGAHPSGLIGEDPNGIPNNLLPFIAQVAVGKRPQLSVFGDDYPTPDGTGVRDYLHVMDLVAGHVQALDYLRAADTAPGAYPFNLGTGRGYSVLEVIRAFEQASGRPIPFQVVDRRPGDVPAYWADPRRAEATLGWTATRDLATMCADTWRWQQGNPDGYPNAD